jgi:hypothetical protein
MGVLNHQRHPTRARWRVRQAHTFGYCPGCQTWTDLTVHHILPRRFFGAPLDAPKISLCWNCHAHGIEPLIAHTNPSTPRKFFFDMVAKVIKAPLIDYVFVSGYPRPKEKRPTIPTYVVCSYCRMTRRDPSRGCVRCTSVFFHEVPQRAYSRAA